MKAGKFKKLITLTLAVTIMLANGVVSFASASNSTATKKQEYVGYLIDVHCNKNGKSEMGNIDVKKNPEKHQTECLKMKNCMDSGLGLSIKEDKTYKFYSFDKTSNKLADDEIMMKTKKKFNNKVAVVGSIKNNILTISTIKEVK